MAEEVLATGRVDNFTIMRIYKDGTFTTQGFGKESGADRLLGFDHDADSMRRKSTTGRGAAALFTGGVSLLAASNNRGVIYVTVTGEQTSVRTFTTRNPSGWTLSSIRSLKAAADTVIGQSAAASAGGTAADVPAQLKQLADLHSAGALSDAEFAAAKGRLLS